VTIAVDSYGPVTDNAQSVFELSVIEQIPGIKGQLKKDYGFDVNFESAKHMLEENDGAGNTFKATAKPVLIGTAVVGATTMIFSIIVVLTMAEQNPSSHPPPFLLGLTTGPPDLPLTGASIQAVSTCLPGRGVHQGQHQARGGHQGLVADSKKVEICTQHAQKGMFNIFLCVFFATLAFAFLEPYFFIAI
jgi:K(+)-stimulated pyrophosphate-energized sodium pump